MSAPPLRVCYLPYHGNMALPAFIFGSHPSIPHYIPLHPSIKSRRANRQGSEWSEQSQRSECADRELYTKSRTTLSASRVSFNMIFKLTTGPPLQLRPPPKPFPQPCYRVPCTPYILRLDRSLADKADDSVRVVYLCLMRMIREGAWMKCFSHKAKNGKHL